MCLAKAYVKKDDGDEVVMTNVAYVEISEDSVVLTTILRERLDLEARVEFIDFAQGSIALRLAGGARTQTG